MPLKTSGNGAPKLPLVNWERAERRHGHRMECRSGPVLVGVTRFDPCHAEPSGMEYEAVMKINDARCRAINEDAAMQLVELYFADWWGQLNHGGGSR